MVKKVYINVTYLEYWEFPDGISNEEIDEKVEKWVEEVHSDCADRDWDIVEE